MATFITSKSVGGAIINAHVETSTGFWKYNHDGSDSSAFPNGWQNLPITNSNGAFTIISCDVDGLLSGDITLLEFYGNNLTSFDGTGLSGLTTLNLNTNQLTSFDGTDLSSLTTLNLNSNNHLTSFDGNGLSSLTQLSLSNCSVLASFDGTDLSSLTSLGLADNQLTSLDGYIFPSSLVNLNLVGNQLTSFNGTGLSSLTHLYLNANQLTSFDGTGLASLTELQLIDNQLTSVDVTGLSSLTSLDLGANQLTSVDVTGLSSLTSLSLYDNQLTPSANNQVLHQLSQNGVMAFGGKGDANGWFSSNNGRTAASNTDYDNLFNNLGWRFQGLDLVTPPVVGSGRLAIRGFIPTTTTTTTEAPTTTTTTTEAPTSTTMSSISVDTYLGKNGETLFDYDVVLSQNGTQTASFVGSDVGLPLSPYDLKLFAVNPNNSSFILNNNGEPIAYSQFGHPSSTEGLLTVRNDLFNGNLRVALCYYTNSSGYVVYDIYPTVFTVS